MNKLFALILLVPAMLFAQLQATNTNGYADTALIWITGTTIGYTGSFKLADYEDIRVIVRCNDTALAGFKADSTRFIWGIQSWTECLNASGVRDTCYDQLFRVDTVDTNSEGTIASVGTMATTGIVTPSTKLGDTLSCTGYLVQSRTISYKEIGNTYFRLWAKGLTGCRVSSSPIKVNFQIARTLYNGIRMR